VYSIVLNALMGSGFSYTVSHSVLSQKIGWEECLPNDLFCVGWDVKP